MSEEQHPICSFCLGDDTEAPPFGTVKDAQDLIRPCTTCSLVTHKKCLLDWFNSLPLKDLYVIDSLNLEELESIRANLNNNNRNEISIENLINISSNMLNQLVSNIGSGTWTLSGPLNAEVNLRGKEMKFLLVDCPQCKQNIVFCMKRNNVLSFYKGLRLITTRMIQYGVASIGVGSAIAGVVSMGYVGLTSCGLKMMDCIIPEQLLVQILSKKANTLLTPTSLSKIIFGNVRNYAIDNLEQALVKGVIDPLKFSRIPILPIVLYRMRSSSWISCLLSNQKDTALYDCSTELMISGYLSSMGNHKLLKTLNFNLRLILRAILTNPKDILLVFQYTKSIDFWDVNNMISMLVPLRWIYDLLFRLTINRFHFNQAIKIRPREVSDSLNSEEVDYIEALSSEVVREQIKYCTIKDKVDKLVDSEFEMRSNIPILTIAYKFLKKKAILHKEYKANSYLHFSKLKLNLWLHKTLACLKNDYSTNFLLHSVTIRALTTVLWPFLSSKVGHMIFNVVFKNSKYLQDIPTEKILLLSNIIGLMVVALLKDLSNLYISTKKAKELSQMSVVCIEPQTSNERNEDNRQYHELNFPGGFEY